jgi:hypothetical protein
MMGTPVRLTKLLWLLIGGNHELARAARDFVEQKVDLLTVGGRSKLKLYEWSVYGHRLSGHWT